MSADFDVFAAQCRTRADAALKARLPAPDSQQPDLAEAMAYCLFNGGKRIRPTLVYATGAALGATDAPGLDTLAAAVECRSEEHTSELQSRGHLVCRLLLEKKK